MALICLKSCWRAKLREWREDYTIKVSVKNYLCIVYQIKFICYGLKYLQARLDSFLGFIFYHIEGYWPSVPGTVLDEDGVQGHFDRE